MYNIEIKKYGNLMDEVNFTTSKSTVSVFLTKIGCDLILKFKVKKNTLLRDVFALIDSF